MNTHKVNKQEPRRDGDQHSTELASRIITEGKTRREAIRCLKRYIAREIYRIITSPPETQPSAA